MAESVRLVSPDEIRQNPENPRIIFREHELRELQDSIAAQGILVPLTVYAANDKSGLVILDGERRWRCARRLGLARVPVIVQPEPSQMQNIMMMFAIHHTRKQWDPLPTAKKLQQLEEIYTASEGRRPNELQLAQLASMSRGEVRRLKQVLALPERYLDELMEEGEKPRPQQTLTVDHVLEATRGSLALRKRGIVDAATEEALTDAIVGKYRTGVIKNTVEPRQLSRIALAVEREELSARSAKIVTKKLIDVPSYSISDAFRDSVARIDLEHNAEQMVRRLSEKLNVEFEPGGEIGDKLYHALVDLQDSIAAIIGQR
jgi:ParB family transcriptional regulator, chromosome partitioning protein